MNVTKGNKTNGIIFKVIAADEKLPQINGTEIIVRVNQDGNMENSNFCVCCGREIPEGAMVCRKCLNGR